MGMFSVAALVLLVGLATAQGKELRNTRTCWCDIRTSPSRDDPVLFTTPEREVIERCPDACRANAESVLGGSVSPLTQAAGDRVCEALRGSHSDPVNLYAHWTASNCDYTNHLYLGQVCCLQFDVPGVAGIQYFGVPC